MKSTLSAQLWAILSEKEIVRFGKFLRSPYFNRRRDVLAVFEAFRCDAVPGTREAFHARLFPDRPFDNSELNYVLNYFSARLEKFLALEEWQGDPRQERLLACRALRKRGLAAPFEQHTRRLAAANGALPYRDAGYWLVEYQLQSELFAARILQSRSGQTNLPAVTGALDSFFALETLRWACTDRALRSLSGQQQPARPLTEAVLKISEEVRAEENPALILLRESYQALVDPEDIAAFQRLRGLLERHIGVFPPGESRDLYMAAINFCIRRHNRGETAYTRHAFDLYRRALEEGALLENGFLARYTYNNIHNLAHLVGEEHWAREFLERYKEHLPAVERENIYRYNLAGFHFRRSQYAAVLPLLQQVEFSDLFINLDVRKMLLRSYFELEEWSALASLLESFQTYLRRQKTLGYHRESYLNLVRFTKKLARLALAKPAERRQLADRIRLTEAVAEREWLLRKTGY